MNKLNIVTDRSEIHISKVYVALNLMTLANLRKFHHERNVYWLDGIFGVLYCNLKGLRGLKRNPGRNVLMDLLARCDNDILLFGNLSGNAELDNRFKSISQLQDFRREIKDLQIKQIREEIVVISLPSPLQEELAHMFDETNTVFCIGGALNMLGDKRFIIPGVVEKFGLEFLWRLRTDTKRRLKRLFSSFFSVLMNVRTIFKDYQPVILKSKDCEL